MGRDNRLTIPEVRPDGLQLIEQHEQQRRYWIIQRVAWWCFAAVMVLAILGLTGSGGVFQKQTIDFAAATVEVPRVSRWEGADGMSITFHQGADTHDVILTQPFFDRFTVETIRPEPDRSTLLPGAQSLTFAADDAPPHKVNLAIRAMHFGWTRFDMTIGGETRSITLLVLP